MTKIKIGSHVGMAGKEMFLDLLFRVILIVRCATTLYYCT